MNKRIIAICIGGILSILAITSCRQVIRNVKIKDIIAALTFVNNCLNGVKQSSTVVTASVNGSYKNLGIYLKNNELNPTTITNMEEYLSVMRAEADTLRLWLNATDENAKVLFQLLEARAEENKTEELRETMLDDIEQKSEEFSEKMKTARSVLKQIEASIQKYNDILGYIQVGIGLDEAEKYIGDVDNAINEGRQLNLHIQKAIDESLAIVNTIQNQNGNDIKLKD